MIDSLTMCLKSWLRVLTRFFRQVVSWVGNSSLKDAFRGFSLSQHKNIP